MSAEQDPRAQEEEAAAAGADPLLEDSTKKRRYNWPVIGFFMFAFVVLFVLLTLFTPLPFYALIMGGLAVGLTTATVAIAVFGWLAVVAVGALLGAVIGLLGSRGFSTEPSPPGKGPGSSVPKAVKPLTEAEIKAQQAAQVAEHKRLEKLVKDFEDLKIYDSKQDEKAILAAWKPFSKDDFAYLNSQNPDRWSRDPRSYFLKALDQAVSRGFIQVVTLLLEQFRKMLWRFPLAYPKLKAELTVQAAEEGQLEMVKFLLDNEPLSECQLSKGSVGSQLMAVCLHIAIRSQNVGMVKLLMDRGADPDEQCLGFPPRNEGAVVYPYTPRAALLKVESLEKQREIEQLVGKPVEELREQCCQLLENKRESKKLEKVQAFLDRLPKYLQSTEGRDRFSEVAQDWSVEHPILVAAIRTNDSAIVEMILSRFGTPSLIYKNRGLYHHPVYYAETTEMAKFLLDKFRQSPSQYDLNQCLSRAIYQKNQSLATFLLEKDAVVMSWRRETLEALLDSKPDSAPASASELLPPASNPAPVVPKVDGVDSPPVVPDSNPHGQAPS